MRQHGPNGKRSHLLMALEPRLMFDGAAVAEAVDTHFDTVDAVPPAAVETGPRVLLLSSAVTDGDDLAAAAKDDVLVVRYDAQADSLDAILSRVSNALDGRQASSIALASHGADGGFDLAAGHEVSLAAMAGDNALQDFFADLGAQIAEGGRMDVLACDVAGSLAGDYLLAYLSDLSGRMVAASDNATGNAAFGGDWRLEAGGVNAGAYFDAAALANFHGLLEVQQVKEINPTGASDPESPIEMNGVMYFNATDGVHGDELWKTDGTAAGTVMVKDILPGATGSNPYGLTKMGDAIYFAAIDANFGTELWKTDGTEGGTVMVKDINPGAGNASVSQLTLFNGELFFRAETAANGQELWKTDGTEAGTVMVKEINANGDSGASKFTEMNGFLYFTANDGSHGTELWKTDGTEAGTVLVKDIRNGGSTSRISGLTVANGTLFFLAEEGTHGRELWKSDGTEAGTVLVKDINPAGNSYPSHFVVLNNTLLFSATGPEGAELWKSDGTEAGTVLVKDINPTGSGSPTYLTVIGNTVYFSATDGTNGTELWKSDGTTAGTVMVKNINGTGDSNPNYLTNVNNVLHFSADDGVHGIELWKSDGTEAGTPLVRDIDPGADSGIDFFSINWVFNYGGKVFFIASDGVNGRELWGDVTATTASSGETPHHTPPPAAARTVAETKTQNIRAPGGEAPSLVTVVRTDAPPPSAAFGRDAEPVAAVSTNLSPTEPAAFRVAALGTGQGRGDPLVVVRPEIVAEAQGTRVSFTLPGNVFASATADQGVSLAATLSDGTALPNWLTFDPATGTFIGRPPAGFQGEMVVRVIARDAQGNEAATTVRINVTGESEAHPPADDQTGKAPPNPAAAVIKLSKFGKPAFQDELRLANRLSNTRQAQLLAAARAVGHHI